MIVVIKKKTMVITALCVLVALMAGVARISYDKPAAAVPVAARTVILDPGHGGEDGGAVGGAGTVEKDLNLAVALKVQQLLEQSGCMVFMTRTEDTSIHDNGEEKSGNRKVSDLNNRKKLPKDFKADAFVSIHMNTFPDPQYYGSQVFYAEKQPGSMELAMAIQQELKQNIDNGNIRESKESAGNIYILNDVSVPSVVVECGFLSNAEEERLLQEESYQQKLAFAIYSGLIQYFSA